MKRKVLFLLFFATVSVSFTGCEGLLDDCKICSFKTYEDGLPINSTQETEYCGVELAGILAKQDVVDGNLVYRWECR
jgi:hypothetical protein